MDSKELEQLTKGIEGILTLYSNLGADFKDIDTKGKIRALHSAVLEAKKPWS